MGKKEQWIVKDHALGLIQTFEMIVFSRTLLERLDVVPSPLAIVLVDPVYFTDRFIKSFILVFVSVVLGFSGQIRYGQAFQKTVKAQKNGQSFQDDKKYAADPHSVHQFFHSYISSKFIIRYPFVILIEQPVLHDFKLIIVYLEPNRVVHQIEDRNYYD